MTDGNFYRWLFSLGYSACAATTGRESEAHNEFVSLMKDIINESGSDSEEPLVSLKDINNLRPVAVPKDSSRKTEPEQDDVPGQQERS
jgi:hypothetical protein